VNRLPPLNWLRSFEAAARHDSFAAAATELHLTAAAISYQVRSLEGELGFKLFERLPRGLRLTDMGRAYLPSLRKAFDDIAISTAGLFGGAREEKLTIRQIYQRFAAARGQRTLIGSASDIADDMEEWFRGYGVDGFLFHPSHLPGGLDDFVALVIPELQSRGLFRAEYEGTTLRENMGLERPQSRYLSH